ncbi:MAG: tetratricopeptide repeat protein [Chthoniobacterales bacterium]|nr:tetratricopeptide repeat protein [Chthoniobacterales bacterium]
MFFRVLLLLFIVTSLGAATTNDPSEEFVAAYRSFKEAERLDQVGRKDEAIIKYRYAENHLVDISNNYPNWQKPIVEYRLSKIRNNLARIGASSDAGGLPPSSSLGRTSASNENDRAPSENSRVDALRSSDEGQREEPRYGESSHESPRYGAEPPPAEMPPSTRSAAPESDGPEPSPQATSKRASDIPTLSIIPPVPRSGASNKELLQLQKQLKQTEAELEKAHNDIVDKTAELDHSKISLVETKAQLTKTERQIVDLKNDLEKDRAGSLQREAALKKSLQQLEGKVAALSADKEVMMEENSGLQQRLQQTANSLVAASNNKNLLEQLQVEVNAEKNASAALHEQLSAAQRERDEAHAESATLAEEMKQASASLVAAEQKGHDLAAVQTQVTALQQQLQQANSSLAEAQKKNAEMDALKVRLAALTAEGTNKEKMLADAQAANKNLQASQKSTLDDLQKKLVAAQADQEVLNEERVNMEARLKQTSEEVASLKKSGADAARVQHQMEGLAQELEKNKKQLSEAQASEMETATIQRQALVELEGKYRIAVMERQSMEAKKGELEQQLTAANEKMKSLMAQPVPNVAAAQSDLQRSQAELQAAKKQLEESEKKIAALEKAAPEKSQLLQDKEKELAAARDEAGKFQKELLSAQQQLTSIQNEVKNRDDHYNDLKKQLDQKNEEIAALQKKGTPEAGQDKIVAENELLKGVVMRELKAEAKRQQIKKLVVEDLDKLKVKSDTLSLQLRKLAKPVRLTDEERALFKDKLPLPPESEQDEEKLIVAVEASKNEKSPALTNSVTGATPASGTNNVMPAKAPTEVKKKEEGKDVKKENPIDQGKYRTSLNKAKEQFEHQNYAEAEKNFQDALSASPNDYITLSNLGVVEFQLGKMSEAESTLKKACVQDPKKSFAFTTLGIVHYRQERFDDAEKVLRQAVAINDQDFTAHNYLGIVLAASGKSKAGESEIMKSIEINPNYADAHFNLAVIYATGKPPAKEMAKTHYKKAVALGAPGDPTLEKLIN